MTPSIPEQPNPQGSLQDVVRRLFRVQVKKGCEWKTRCSHYDREQAERCYNKDVWAGYEARIEEAETPNIVEQKQNSLYSSPVRHKSTR